MKTLLHILLFCCCAVQAQQQKYILLDSLTANYKVKQYTLSTLPYKVDNTIEIYNVFSKNYGKNLDSDFIVLFSVLPNLESKSNWQEIALDTIQQKYLPAKKLFDRIYNRTYNSDDKIKNYTLSLVKKVKGKYYVAKNYRINEFFCINNPTQIQASGIYVIDTYQPVIPKPVLKAKYKKQYPKQDFPLDELFWKVPKHLERIYLANVEEKEGDIIYYFYIFSNSFVDDNSIDEFAYIKDKGIVAGSYEQYFFPYGKTFYRGGDWLKVRRPYKKELFWAEELKKEWAEKEMNWKKEREREEKEFRRR